MAESSRAHNCMGIVRGVQGRVAEAARYFRAAIALEPQSIEGHNNLAATILRDPAQDPHVACTHLNIALAHDPTYEDARENRVVCAIEVAARLGSREQEANPRAQLLRQAEADLERLERTQTSTATYGLRRAQLAQARGQTEDAEEILRRCLSDRTHGARCAFELATIHLQTGECAKSLSHFDRAVRSDDPDLKAAALQSREAARQLCPVHPER
jgi:tetratricopeptide (TPR) repeat protein